MKTGRHASLRTAVGRGSASLVSAMQSAGGGLLESISSIDDVELARGPRHQLGILNPEQFVPKSRLGWCEIGARLVRYVGWTPGYAALTDKLGERRDPRTPQTFNKRSMDRSSLQGEQMMTPARTRSARWLLCAFALVVLSGFSTGSAYAQPKNTGKVTFTTGVDFTSAYFFRGVRAGTRGLYHPAVRRYQFQRVLRRRWLWPERCHVFARTVEQYPLRPVRQRRACGEHRYRGTKPTSSQASLLRSTTGRPDSPTPPI